MKLALNTVHRRQYSETFIRRHFEELKFEKKYFLSGGYLPYLIDDQPVVKTPLLKVRPSAIHHLYGPGIRRRLAGWLRKNEMDLVLSEYGPCGVEMAPVCRAAGIPQAVYFHGYDISRKDVLRRYGKSYGKYFGHFCLVLCVSEAMADRLMEMGCPAGKIRVFPCIPDPAVFGPSDSDLQAGKILCVGRLVETKGQAKLLEAIARLRHDIPELKLHLAGDGPLRKRLEELAERLGIAEQVIFHGILTPGQVSELMKDSYVCVQPSMTAANGQMEGMPLAVTEALLSGKAVVSSRHAGIPEHISDGENGLLVDEGSVTQLAEAIRKLHESRELTETLGRRAAEYMQQSFVPKYSMEVLKKNLIDSLRKS